MGILALVMGYTLTGIIGLLGLMVIWLIYSGKINLAKLISEENGDASMSRFQFLVFTFVISLSLFFIVVSLAYKGEPGFPPIKADILALLGISGGSYLISKGVQKASENKNGDKNKPVGGG